MISILNITIQVSSCSLQPPRSRTGFTWNWVPLVWLGHPGKPFVRAGLVVSCGTQRFCLRATTVVALEIQR